MEDILKTILENTSYNPMYIILGVGLGLFFIFVILKKLFKLAMFLFVVFLAYLGFMFLTDEEAGQKIKDKLDIGKSAIETIDEATEDVREEAVDKIINEMEKKRKDIKKKDE